MATTFSTPDGTRLGYASRSTRLFGQVIDGAVAAAPFIAALLISSVSDALAGIATLLSFGWAVFYYFLADGLHDGQSVAKRWLAIRVVDARTGAPCSFGQSFLRNLLLALLGPLDWIFIFGEQHQRLGDKAAGTIVIDAD
ncbi:MAG TPA: RDD family protein [Gemmatimonadaceae bacterium]